MAKLLCNIDKKGRLLCWWIYRLAPEFPYPTAVNDCWHALLWVDDNRDKFNGLDLSLVVAGDSAGGNLVAIMAQRSTKNGPRLPCHGFNCCFY
ncbi:MAG: hypothetical protein CL866_02455 [Cycloclasticus sp.]|nr:hypothetical protein [Cycloclasticus sp.]MBG95719.1 hypothetical protein [Cycloclasticus sp.]